MRAVKCEILGQVNGSIHVAIYWRRFYGLLPPKRVEYMVSGASIICEDGRRTDSSWGIGIGYTEEAEIRRAYRATRFRESIEEEEVEDKE